ncbi:MAG: phosphonate C-P lyase system protein PhnL [Alphaproteobacteria bacterium]
MTAPGPAMIRIEGLAKAFTLHNQGGVHLPVLADVGLTVHRGECVVLTGASGAGKSSLMRAIYGNYAASAGSIRVRHGDDWVDMAAAAPRMIIAVRRASLGYVSQFLRVIPRVPAIDVVAGPLLQAGVDTAEARARAATMLARLNLPERLWSLPPATFSGGEQQRVNIAHGFVRRYPILLLDEPTASLDAANRHVVIELIGEARAAGAALVGIFHDADVRGAVATRTVDVEAFRPAA